MPNLSVLLAHQCGWDEKLLVAGPVAVVAGLAAEGETLVANAHHVERGYQDLVGNLSRLGADVS